MSRCDWPGCFNGADGDFEGLEYSDHHLDVRIGRVFECRKCDRLVSEEGTLCDNCQSNQEDPCYDEPNLPDLERDRQVEAIRMKR